MNNYIYYHLFLPEESAAWSNYFMEQYKLCEDHGLIDKCNQFYLVTVGSANQTYLANGLASNFPKVTTINFNNIWNDDTGLHTLDTDLMGNGPRPVTESATEGLIWEHAHRENANFLYLHAKGVTSYERCLRSNQFTTFRNYFYWRKFLEWGVIENWNKCINYLDMGYDVVSCNYTTWPMRHFSGNYWWSKSEYIKLLPDIREHDWWKTHLTNVPVMQSLTWRLRDEMWICSNPSCLTVSLKDASRPPPDGTLAVDLMRRSDYI